ncbi:UDP-Glycosyltransferase/glycogen phosphorylase [Ganoderma leucocontextum]|nr:UDP-Glycosyltransferase/glycogen phosphorylase [Ganoderma leucocontextum]
MAYSRTHIIAFTYQAWGRARPLINLSARLVKLCSIDVTILIANSFYERVRAELARSFEPGEDDLMEHIRIVSYGDVQGPSIRSDEGDALFEVAWKSIVSEQESVCAYTGIRYAPLIKPKAIVLDLFAVDPFRSVKAISGESVKVYAWEPSLVSSIFHLFGPEKLGGRGNARVIAEGEARRTGQSYQDVVLEMFFHPAGRVIRAPAMPPMYDYEYWPQDFPMPDDAWTKIFPRVYETLEAVDGILLVTPESYEPEAVAAMKEWFAETGRPAYVCGPSLPSASKAMATMHEMDESDSSEEVKGFLDATLARSGENTLLYISFGSLFWPVKNPEALWAVLDAIMERGMPFILSQGSPLAVIPDDMKAKVKAYGQGLLTSWTPQQHILDHPATGLFLNHGGHNSVIEAICAGVSQIVWPFGSDQPLNAILVSEKLQIGYELLEVRSGNGLKPICRNGRVPTGTVDAVKAEMREVLGKAFGEDGEKKRARLAQVKKAVLAEWEDGGASKRDVVAFLDCLPLALPCLDYSPGLPCFF